MKKLYNMMIHIHGREGAVNLPLSFPEVTAQTRSEVWEGSPWKAFTLGKKNSTIFPFYMFTSKKRSCRRAALFR